MTNSTKAWLVECETIGDKSYIYARDAYTAIRNYWLMDCDNFEIFWIDDQNIMCGMTAATRCYEMDGKIKQR